MELDLICILVGVPAAFGLVWLAYRLDLRQLRIEIRGFGSFTINRRPPRLGRNPRSGESVQIPEKRVPHFKPGKALREAVDQGSLDVLHGKSE